MKSTLPTSVGTETLTLARRGQLGLLRRRYQTVSRRRSGFPVLMSATSWNKDRASSKDCAPPPRVVTADRHVGLGEEVPLRMQKNNQEEQIEKIIFRFRFFTLLGVFGSLVGSMLCFFKGCVIIVSSFLQYFSSRGRVVQMLIEAVDVYLIGTVMLVFGMGLYELFISDLDIGKTSSSRSNFFGLFILQERPKWLEIKSVNELKTKLGHVIVMVLLVGLVEKCKMVVITSPIDLLCFAASILFSSCGLYLLSKLKH